MILTKAYITKTPDLNSNIFEVRVPLLEDNTHTEALFSALLCCDPASYNGYKVGDCVYVNFEDDQYNNAVIIGRLFTEVPTTSSSYLLANSLKVTGTAYLPPSTKIGDYTAQDITNLYNGVANGGTGSLDEEELKKYLEDYVKYTPTERGTEEEPKPYYAKNIQCMTGKEYDAINWNPEDEDKKKALEHTLFFLTSVPESEDDY